MSMENTPPSPHEDADDRLHTDSVSSTSEVRPEIDLPRRPTGDNVADKFPSVPGSFNVSLGLQNSASQFSESNVLGSRSFSDDRSIEPSQNGIGNSADPSSAQARLGIAAQGAASSNVEPGDDANKAGAPPSTSKRRIPPFRSLSPPPKRRWNSDPTPPLDPPDLEQDVIAAAAQPQQQPLEQQQLLLEQEYPEPVDEQNINAQNGNGEVASNYLFLSTTHYSSNRVIHFHFDDDRHFSGRIDITGFQNVPITVWASEVHMEFVSESFMNNASDDLYHYASGVITFPAVIDLQNFVCWIDGNYLYFQVLIL